MEKNSLILKVITSHTHIFPRGWYGVRWYIEWKTDGASLKWLHAVLFVKWSHMVKNDIYPKTTLIYGHFELWSKKKLALAIS